MEVEISGRLKTCASVTSYREGAVVSSVYDEAVHVQGDRRRLGVGGIVTGPVVLQQRQNMLSVVVLMRVSVCVCEREIIHMQVSTSVPQ